METLLSSALDRLKNVTSKISSYEVSRKENMLELERLYNSLKLNEKVADFKDIFEFKAINLSGMSLQKEDLGAIKDGKYTQLIGIKYDKNAKVKNRNESLAYYGRSEKVSEEVKTEIISFVLRWRFEKSFMTLEHYHIMIGDFKSR
jgi:hypothetical protein